jgi:hypothetical protein
MKYKIILTLEAQSRQEAIEEARYRFYTHNIEPGFKNHGVEVDIEEVEE